MTTSPSPESPIPTLKALIKEFEGCELTAYRCPAGVLTIGYGHTAGVKAGQKITQEKAEALLEQDCKNTSDSLSMKVRSYSSIRLKFKQL